MENENTEESKHGTLGDYFNDPSLDQAEETKNETTAESTESAESTTESTEEAATGAQTTESTEATTTENTEGEANKENKATETTATQESPEPYNWATFGEEVTSAADVHSLIDTLKTQNGELEKKLKETQSPFADPSIEYANKLFPEYGHNAFALARKIADFKHDPTNPVEALVQADIIAEPGRAGYEKELYDKYKDEYDDLEGFEKNEFLIRSKKAAESILAKQEEIKKLGVVDTEAIEREKTRVSQVADGYRSRLTTELAKVKLPESEIEFNVGSPDEIAAYAIKYMNDSGDVSKEGYQKALESARVLAMINGLKSGELIGQIEKQITSKVKLKDLEEKENPSTTDKTDSQKTDVDSTKAAEIKSMKDALGWE